MSDEQQVSEVFDDLARKFDNLCNERHMEGQEKYGVFTFLGNDVLRMMLEELADTVNYCRMQGIKLMLLQDAFEQDERLKAFSDDEQNVTIGFQSFKGTKDVGWKK